MTDSRIDTPELDEQSIDALKDRFQRLHKKRIETKVRLDNAQQHLDTLKAQAREAYATDDVGELQAMLAERRAENERLRASYQSHLDAITAKLDTIARDHDATRSEEPTDER